MLDSFPVKQTPALGLGTVQFGRDYGVSNPAGQVPLSVVRRLMEVAAGHEIRFLDTAMLYGTSESVLGEALAAGHRFEIVTKTPVFGHDPDPSDADRAREAAERSFERLRASRLYGLLAHDADDLLRPGGDRLYGVLRDLRDEGRIRKIGASVYDGRQIDALLDRYRIDLIQLPLNVFDQRLIGSGHLARLVENGVEAHVRSAFLQGALLMAPGDLPPRLEALRAHLEAFERSAAAAGVSRLDAALGFLRTQPVDVVLVGVTAEAELRQIIESWRLPIPALDFGALALHNDDLLNPSRWNG